MMFAPLPPPPESPEQDVLDEETMVKKAECNELTVDELKQYIAAGKDVNYQDENGNTALMWTALQGQTELTQILLDANAEVNMQDNDVLTALHLAIDQNEPDTIVQLIKAGADVNMQDNYGRTALHWAVDCNEPDTIVQLIKAGADVNMQDKDGRTALHLAVDHNLPDVIVQLIKAGADVNMQDNYGRTALHFAFDAASMSLVLDAKASLCIHDVDGETPMHRLFEDDCDSDDMMRLLLEHGTCKDTGFTALMEAARRGYVPAVKKLLALGANVYEKDKYGTTALDMASSEECTMLLRQYTMMSAPLPPPPESPDQGVLDNETMVHKTRCTELTVDELKQYIAAGKDVSYQDQYGNTALMWTAYHGRAELTQMLLDANADVNIQDKDGWTALHRAAVNNHPGVIAQLIKAKADVNIQRGNGWTALHYALNSAHMACVSLLLDAKANLWLEDVYRETPMFLGLQEQHSNDEMMRLLLEHGTCKDTGCTALMEAARRSNVPAVKKLLILGAKVYEKDKYGTTALDVASSEGCAKLLRQHMMMSTPLPPPLESPEQDELDEETIVYKAYPAPHVLQP